MNRQPEIFFHVGLGKVASSFLQQRFFPKLHGIHFLPTRHYSRSKKIIANLRVKKVLVSREFDRQFEREVRWFTRTCPEAGIIVIFRRHEDWIASQYKRHVKNGWYHGFQQFFDLQNDGGLWQRKDLMYYPKLEIIEECSKRKPLVLFYDELQNDPWSFLQKIATYTGTTFEQDQVALSKVHKSYSEKQLKVLQRFCKSYIKKIPDGYRNKVKHWLCYRPYWALFHLVLVIANFFPESWIKEEPLIGESLLAQIRSSYQEDWEKVQRYARGEYRSD